MPAVAAVGGFLASNAGAIVGGALSAAGTLAASRSASSASRAATAAQTQATADQIAAAEAQYQRTRELFSGYLQDGDLADAYLRALYEGSATFGGGQAGYGGTVSAASLEQTLRQQNPDMAAYWDRWEAAGEARDNGHRATFGDFIGYVSAERPQAVAAAQQQLTAQNVTGAAQPAQTITREQVLAQINGTPLAQAAQQWLDTRNQIDTQNYSGAQTLAQQERTDLEGTAQRNYADALAEADRARTGRRGESDAQLQQRLSNNAQVRDAWNARATNERDRAIDQEVSRFGVSGQLGAARRGVAQVGQEYALDFANLDADLNAQAYDPYFAQNWDTETGYWGTRGDSTDTMGAANTYAAVNYGNRNQRAYDTYAASRRGNYDQYTQDWGGAYTDYLENNLGRRSSRGQTSRNVISGAGADMTDRITSAVGARGQAQAASAQQQGAIQQQLYGDLANIAGNAVTSIWNRKKT